LFFEGYHGVCKDPLSLAKKMDFRYEMEHQESIIDDEAFGDILIRITPRQSFRFGTDAMLF
jgi:hypothetical protein